MEHLSLLAGGQEHTVADWEREAAAVLRKAGRLAADDADSAVWDKLTRTTLDGIAVTPLGTPGPSAADAATRGTIAARASEGWDNRPVFSDPDAAQSAADVVTDLENGATSLWLTVGAGGIAVSDLAVVLDKVLLDIAPVALESTDPVAAAEALVSVLDAKGVSAAPGTSLGADPIGDTVRGEDADVAAVVERVAEIARSRNLLAITVDATVVHDLGASDVQELGYSLAAGAAYLRLLTAAGLSVEDAAALMEFRYAATDEQFPTIAKLRAARRLWARMLELSGASESARGQRQHAVTSRPMMTKYDPWVNMLRTTVAAFAAGVGGAQAVTVLPFDAALGLPDAFSRRIARNTSSLLISEAHVGKVIDPAGGSYAVERLTDDLAQAGWAELGRLEEAGGVLAAVADGSLRARIDEVVARRDAEIARRKRPVTGVSEFPNLHEVLPERKPYPASARKVRSYAAAFEAMRDDAPAQPVFLATLGSIAAHTARATFAHNLLAAGGVDTVSAGPTESADDLVAAYDMQPVVCLCGTDAAYAEWGAEAIAALRAAGASYVILAGRPGEGIEVDDSAAMGIDALAFLTRVREELGK
ncbi:MAG TPA: methylmalonyl-CoA mutase family protein [Nocardioidaceae bacterium]|nr:methylmalonyl-CoA mutase family protein [Nocardioidaceae bacterium]